MAEPADDIARHALRRRLAALQRFERWSEDHPLHPGPEAGLSGVGLLYDLLPAGARSRPVDPSGVVELHRSLSVLESRPR